jgi:hypothetical protein
MVGMRNDCRLLARNLSVRVKAEDVEVWMLRKCCRLGEMEVDGTGSVVCSAAGCGISRVEPSCSAIGGVTGH